MRLLLTATSLDPSYGGPAFSVSRLATALADAGLEVGLWTPDGSVATSPMVPAGARVERLLGPFAAAIAAFAPDIVHDNGLWRPHNHQVASAAARCGVPRIVSTRGMLEPWALAHKRWKKRLAWRLYQRRDLDRAAALHATAPSEAGSLARLRLRPPVQMIPNGMDLPPLAPRPAGSATVRTALFLGRIYPVKGLPMLVEAWARTRPPGWRLVIAGPDEAGHRAEVERRVAQAGLGDMVSFPGPVHGDAKSAVLGAADLFVLPSHSESFGMAVAEALAHEVPVLTTTAAPWPQLTERGCGRPCG